MEHEYRTLRNRQRIDVIEYIKEYLEKHPDTQILVGTDSQNRRSETIYAVVIGLYIQGKGAHVLFNRFTVPREKDTVTRLLNEVWESVKISEEILKELKVRVSVIDIDINPDPKYKSNVALASAVGIVQGMGYVCRDKGKSPLMTYCADSLVK